MHSTISALRCIKQSIRIDPFGLKRHLLERSYSELTPIHRSNSDLTLRISTVDPLSQATLQGSCCQKTTFMVCKILANPYKAPLSSLFNSRLQVFLRNPQQGGSSTTLDQRLRNVSDFITLTNRHSIKVVSVSPIRNREIPPSINRSRS